MFGYVRPFKPYLRMCEYEVYRAVYCGVCKSIGRNFGQIPRFTLSYDLAFLALCDMSVNNEPLKCEMQRCIAHPLYKRNCGTENNAIERSAYVWAILVYHKLMDDLSDGDSKDRIAAKAALPFFEGAYRKARVKYRNLSRTVEEQMKLQHIIEKEKCSSLDRAGEPTSEIMKAVFETLSDDTATKEKLGRFGYFLGRYIYLTDALDDLIKDADSGCYNPLLQGINGRPTAQEFKAIAKRTELSIRLTLGALAECYVSLDMVLYKTVIDNIIYLGLDDIFKQVKERRFNKRKQKGTLTNERSV